MLNICRQLFHTPAKIDGKVVVAPYVVMQLADVGSVIHAVRVVQVVLSHLPDIRKVNVHEMSSSFIFTLFLEYCLVFVILICFPFKSLVNYCFMHLLHTHVRINGRVVDAL